MFTVWSLFASLLSIKLLSLGLSFYLCTPIVASKLYRLLCGLIVRVVTGVEFRGYSAPDVALTSQPGTPPEFTGVLLQLEKHQPIFKLTPFINLSPPSLLLLHQSPSLSTSSLPQACAPLYSWRTEKDTPRSDATGTCYLSAHNFTKFVEYAPCRTGNLSFRVLC